MKLDSSDTKTYYIAKIVKTATVVSRKDNKSTD